MLLSITLKFYIIRLHGKPVLYKSEYTIEFLENLAENIKNLTT
jgi:uncharacterized protein YecE (DUF72 family)